ncbi:MAG: hypothetical protein LBB74_09280 [Chitinispirillales bacterium]|jgi:uncharacterized protein (TIGR02145 family)|nr:hypothetical protein [Chitinispirillales bacterium]
MELRLRLVRGRRLLALALVAGAALLTGCGGGDGGGVGVDPGNGGNGGSGETVLLGGKTWMKKNLNVQTADSWCYGNDASNCAKYGRLYTWSAAVSACRLLGSGWRLPTRADWDALEQAVGGSSVAGRNLKSTSGWYDNGNGTDGYGFTALPGGYRYSGGSFGYAGNYGLWWTATEHGGGNAYRRYVDYYDDYVREYYNDVGGGFSVRCVGD